MSDWQTNSDLSGWQVPIDESELQEEVMSIAERALWNPAHVTPFEVQKLAAVIVAHVRRLRVAGHTKPGSSSEPGDAR